MTREISVWKQHVAINIIQVDYTRLCIHNNYVRLYLDLYVYNFCQFAITYSIYRCILMSNDIY